MPELCPEDKSPVAKPACLCVVGEGHKTRVLDEAEASEMLFYSLLIRKCDKMNIHGTKHVAHQRKNEE